jgi:hypothetical protein
VILKGGKWGCFGTTLDEKLTLPLKIMDSFSEEVTSNVRTEARGRIIQAKV